MREACLIAARSHGRNRFRTHLHKFAEHGKLVLQAKRKSNRDRK